MVEQMFGSDPRNFSEGIVNVEIPELDPKIEGKVRDMWVVDGQRIIVTTDRQSAFDRMICTIPQKGTVLNSLSAWWFEGTRHVIPNHFIVSPHSNVMIVREAHMRIPVEVVFRRYIAKSSTKTSIYYNYAELGRRDIYGIKFPNSLKANQEFSFGTILTPTTKAEEGHDQELTDEEAQELADKVGGKRTWEKMKTRGLDLFELAYRYHRSVGLILVDTKFEFGLDKDGNLMIIDEVFTPDSSRIWKRDTYWQRFEKEENPETFDKEILRRWLASQGFTGDGDVPFVPQEIIEKMRDAYKVPYEIVTRQKLSDQTSDEREIRDAILSYLENLKT